jgi:PUA domain protein
VQFEPDCTKKYFFWKLTRTHQTMKKFTVKKRHTIRKGQITDIFARLKEQIGEGANLFQAETVEILETSTNLSFYLVNKKPVLMEYGGWVFPTLKGAIERPFPQRNGADVMRPGITCVTPDVRAQAPVQVVDERHGKPLAIGIALLDGPQIEQSTVGKMCKNVHYVGDEIWNVEF